MSKRKWLSLLLSLTLIFSLLQTALPVITAAEANTYPSAALTLNGAATTTWTVLGEVPETFGDNTSPARFEYWSGNPLNFELQHEQSELEAGVYQLSLEVYSENADSGAEALLYATTSEGSYSTPIVYSGSSWTAPATLQLKGIEIGSDGKVLLGIKMTSTAGHYGYVRSMSLEKMPEVDSYQSEQLTVNDQPATWTVLGERPTQFGDNTSPARFEYWNAEAMDFELQHEKSGVDAGSYYLSFELYSSDANPSKTSPVTTEAYVYAATSKGTYKIPLEYSGSTWEKPAKLVLNGIEVGNDGNVLLGIKLASAADHYGYIRNFQLQQGAPVKSVSIKPNSAVLRPDRTVQLTVTADNNQQISFQSSNEAVATVDEQGLVTAVGNGEAIITMTAMEQDQVAASGTSRIYVSDTLQTNYSPVAVEPIEQLEGDQRQDFMMGVDISTLDALTAIDRKYYSAAGVEIPLLELLKENGVNWVRLRTWVDPADEQGNPYGAGNIDTEALVRMASQVKDPGIDMNLLVDLHYSDFWTDPGRQGTPKSWIKQDDATTIAELKQEVYDYTYATLQSLEAAGAYPDMIQIGNEINGGMLWPYGNSAEKAKPYIEQGIKAVRDFETAVGGEHIDIVIHRANPGDGLAKVTSFYKTYEDLDYDVIGLSYYPFWHGSLNNLQAVMDNLAATFNKKIAVVETSYGYTLEDPIYNGPTGHIFGQAQADIAGYKATPQGQANAIRDVIAAVAAVPDHMGAGIFYWEPAWLLGTDTGWATHYAEKYQGEEIPEDGGSSWANQAMVNYFGEALPSLNVFAAVRASKDDYVAPTIVAVDDIELTTSQEVYVAPPVRVKALFSDDTYRLVDVASWTPGSYDYNKPGQYKLTGTLADNKTITATITVRPKNYIVNPGIEDEDMSAWQLAHTSRAKDAPYSGEYAIHFWSGVALEDSVSAKQQITNLPDGIYELSVQTRIGTDGTAIASTSMLYATSAETTYSAPLEVTGWDKWKQIIVADIEVSNGELEVGVSVDGVNNDYGDFDDWELIRTGDLPGTTPGPSNPSDSSTAVPGPVLTSSQVNGKTVLTATVSSQASSLSIPVTELVNQTGAELVLTWGDQTLTIAQADLMKQATVSSTDKIVITKEVKEQLSLALAGGKITTLLAPVQWKVTQHTADGQQTLDVPLQLALKTALTGASSSSAASVAASSIALYTVNENGTLAYVRGIQQSAADNVTQLSLQAGQLYTVAAVTREFADVNEQSDAVRKLVAAGVVQGDQRGALNLQQHATRAEVSKLTVKLLDAIGGKLNGAANVADEATGAGVQQGSSGAKSFTDLPDNHWAKPFIDQLTASKLLIGVSEHAFAPNSAMSHESLYVMIARALGLSLDEQEQALLDGEAESQQAAVHAHAWAQAAIAAAAKAGILTQAELQQTDFTVSLTREQLFTIFYRLFDYVEQQ